MLSARDSPTSAFSCLGIARARVCRLTLEMDEKAKQDMLSSTMQINAVLGGCSATVGVFWSIKNVTVPFCKGVSFCDVATLLVCISYNSLAAGLQAENPRT